MSSRQKPSPDDEFASELERYDEAIRSGQTASNTDQRIDPQLEKAKSVLQLLGEIWPSQTSAAEAKPLPTKFPAKFGRFVLRRELGRGGFGVVYEAQDKRLGRRVALKVPYWQVVTSPALREQFLAEARLSAALKHPNIVPIYDAGKIGPYSFIVSELCEGGENLADWLKRQPRPIPFRTAARIALQLAEAVACAQDHGILHRDIKPSNVLLAKPVGDHRDSKPVEASLPFVPKLTDFGLGKFLRENSDGRVLGTIVGTPDYIAPELSRGGAEKATAAADVFALGAVLHELLVGRPPGRAIVRQEDGREEWTATGEVRAHRKDIPKDLEAICLQAIAGDPARRYPNAGELAKELNRFMEGRPTDARPLTLAKRMYRWARRHPLEMALVMLASTFIGVSAAGAWLLNERVLDVQEEVVEVQEIVQEQQQSHEEQRRKLLDHEYLADIKSAQMAVDSADVAMCVKLLSRHLPGAVGEDRRGFEWHRLWRLCHDETKVFVDHDDAVYHAAFSRDGKELAVVSADGRLTVWNLATGKARVLSDPHRGEANAVIYTADGRFLVSCSDDTTIKVRSSAGDLLRTLRGHTMAVMTIAVHPAQPLLLSGSRDGHVRLWNVDTGDLVREWKVMDGETVDAVTFNADGTQAYASGGRGKITHLPDIISSDQQRTVAQMGAAHTAILLRADDSELVVAGHGKDVVILDAQTGERLRRWETQSDWVQGMALADNGDSLVTASRNGMVQVWSLEDGARLNRLTGHRSRVWGVAVSPDGALIASCGEDRTVRLWSAHRAGTDPVLWSSRAPLTALADGPLGSSILFGNQRGMVRHLDAATGEEIANWRLKGAVASLTSSMSGRLAACSEDGEIRVWNHTGRREEVVYRWSLAGTVSIVLSPDGRRLAACTKTGRLVLWNVGSDDAVAMVNAHASGAVLAFDSTGETIFSGGYDNFVKAWDGSTLEQKGEFAGHTQFVNTLAESRELGLLASASTDGSSALLRLPGLEPVGEIHGLGPALKAARFFSDARTLITVDVKGTVHTWNLPTSQVAMSMDTCLFEVRDARLTRDGRHWVLLGRTQGSGKWTILSWPIAMGSDRVMSGE